MKLDLHEHQLGILVKITALILNESESKKEKKRKIKIKINNIYNETSSFPKSTKT